MFQNNFVKGVIQKQTEMSLEESKDKLEQIFQSASDSIIVTDLEGTVMEANQRVNEVLGIAETGIIGAISWDIVDAGDRSRAREDWDKLVKEGHIRKLEYHITKKDGSHIIGEVNASVLRNKSGNPVGYVLLIRDITERKKTEAQLKRSEMQFRKLFNAMTECVALIAPDGRILKANRAEARLFGLKSPSAMKGKPFMNPNWEFINADGTSLSVEKSCVMKAMKRKRNVRNMIMGIVKEDGFTLWLNVNAVPLINESGRVMGVVRTMSDITEQKKLRDEEQQYIAQITKLEDEERKRLAYDLHEDTAQSLASLLLELGTFSQKGERIHVETVATLRKLREITKNTLNEVRSYSYELHPCMLETLGLSAALREFVDKANNRGEFKVTFNVVGTERRLPVEIELALFRIAEEALQNVCKQPQAAKADVIIRYTTNKVRLTITDDGKGFDVVQKREPAPGSLGLTGIRKRAQLVGASFRIESKIGSGTTLSIEVMQ